MDAPGACGTAFGLNRPAAGFRFQRSAYAMQLHAARAGVYPYRARRSLLQRDASAAAVGFECAGNVISVN